MRNLEGAHSQGDKAARQNSFSALSLAAPHRCVSPVAFPVKFLCSVSTPMGVHPQCVRAWQPGPLQVTPAWLPRSLALTRPPWPAPSVPHPGLRLCSRRPLLLEDRDMSYSFIFLYGAWK